MAEKKKEGLGALKETTGGKRRDDRNVACKNFFDNVSIDSANVVTVIYMLKSPENNVVIKAIAGLENFGGKDVENLKLLFSSGIFEYLFPLLKNKDFLIRRFTLKLIGILCGLEEFREEVLRIKGILKTFSDILKRETDIVLQEYASLILAQLSVEYVVASELLTLEDCIETLFLRITAPDPDVQKNCLEVMNHLLNDVNGIEAFVESPKFDVKRILNLVFSSYPVIQAVAIEVLTQLTSLCRDAKVLFAFRDALGVESILDILENEKWCDLHQATLHLLINVTDCPEMCDYLLQSGCLSRLVKLLDNTEEKTNMEKMFGVLARMSQSKRGRLALHVVNIEERFVDNLGDAFEDIQESACLGIANMAHYPPSLDVIMNENPIKQLTKIAVNSEKSLSLRNMAAYAINILSNADERAPEALTNYDTYEELLTILNDSADLPTELCHNVIQAFVGISHTYRFKNEVVNKKTFSTFLKYLPNDDGNSSKDVSLQVDILECLSEYLIESEARSVFNKLCGAGVLLNCLRSKFASVREWAGHLVVIMSQSKDFIKAFIKKDGLEWMLKEKNTMYSMPSWQSAIETIFSNFLPAKFAYTGRLDFHDITQDGFYIVTNPNIKFALLDYYFEEKISPVVPVYVANFSVPIVSQMENETNSVLNSQISVFKTMEPQNLTNYPKGTDKNLSDDCFLYEGHDSQYSVDLESITSTYSSVNFKKLFPDACLNEHLYNLKKKINKEELPFGDKSWFSIHPKLISERAKIIAEFVADEMSGPESDPICSIHYKKTYVTEMKYYLGTNIFPLGLIRMGDYLERAMLFKVLADRIGFPCALVRGSHGRAWIEISVPVINIEDFEDLNTKDKLNSLTSNLDTKLSNETADTNESSKIVEEHSSGVQCAESNTPEGDFWFPKLKLDNFKGFPSQLLKPNAIIDLIDEPGRILSINSFEAKQYCGAFLFGQ